MDIYIYMFPGGYGSLFAGIFLNWQRNYAKKSLGTDLKLGTAFFQGHLFANKQHLKMDGWKMSFLLGRPIFRGYVSFTEGTWMIFGWRPIQHSSVEKNTP